VSHSDIHIDDFDQINLVDVVDEEVDDLVGCLADDSVVESTLDDAFFSNDHNLRLVQGVLSHLANHLLQDGIAVLSRAYFIPHVHSEVLAWRSDFM
jgi:hypothetical protein